MIDISTVKDLNDVDAMQYVEEQLAKNTEIVRTMFFPQWYEPQLRQFLADKDESYIKAALEFKLKFNTETGRFEDQQIDTFYRIFLSGFIMGISFEKIGGIE